MWFRPPGEFFSPFVIIAILTAPRFLYFRCDAVFRRGNSIRKSFSIIKVTETNIGNFHTNFTPIVGLWSFVACRFAESRTGYFFIVKLLNKRYSPAKAFHIM